jgi:putative transposase
LRQRLLQLATERWWFGYQRLHVLLGREGFPVNVKRIYRLYKEEGLSVRKRIRKRLKGCRRKEVQAPTGPGEQWPRDFTSDALAIEADTSLLGLWVGRVLGRVVNERGRAEVIVTDNGPEFTRWVFDPRCNQRGIRHHFIQPGKPMQNGASESFNWRFRDECLNEHWFRGVQEARKCHRSLAA